MGSERVQSGLASGEGLILAVRDPPEPTEEVPDPPCLDRRLLVYEAEMARP